MEKSLPVRSFGTVLSNPEHRTFNCFYLHSITIHFLRLSSVAGPHTMGNFQPTRTNMKAERGPLLHREILVQTAITSEVALLLIFSF